MTGQLTHDRRVVVLVNPEAGRRGPVGNGPGPDAIARALDAVGLASDLRVPDEASAVARLARQAVESGAGVVVAAGGDGTVRMVAEAVFGRETWLGILPMGTVMNIARMLGIPRDLDEAATLLATGSPRTIDVGEVGGALFLEGVSIGLSSDVFHFAHDLQHGQVASPLAFIRTLARYRPVQLTALVDDRQVSTRVLATCITNGPYVGAGLTVAPQAQPDDGMLDLVLFERFTRWELLRHFAGIAFGRRRVHPKVRRLATGRVRIETRLPLPVRVDGDDIGTTPIEARVVPRALTVIAPPAA